MTTPGTTAIASEALDAIMDAKQDPMARRMVLELSAGAIFDPEATTKENVSKIVDIICLENSFVVRERMRSFFEMSINSNLPLADIAVARAVEVFTDPNTRGFDAAFDLFTFVMDKQPKSAKPEVLLNLKDIYTNNPDNVDVRGASVLGMIETLTAHPLAAPEGFCEWLETAVRNDPSPQLSENADEILALLREKPKSPVVEWTKTACNDMYKAKRTDAIAKLSNHLNTTNNAEDIEYCLSTMVDASLTQNMRSNSDELFGPSDATKALIALEEITKGHLDWAKRAADKYIDQLLGGEDKVERVGNYNLQYSVVPQARQGLGSLVFDYPELIKSNLSDRLMDHVDQNPSEYSSAEAIRAVIHFAEISFDELTRISPRLQNTPYDFSKDPCTAFTMVRIVSESFNKNKQRVSIELAETWSAKADELVASSPNETERSGLLSYQRSIHSYCPTTPQAQRTTGVDRKLANGGA